MIIRRLGIYLGVSLCMIVGTLFFHLPASPEPVYRGKTINGWLKVSARALQLGYGDNHADEAVRDAGPEIVPYLIAALNTKESLYDRIYKKVWYALPAWFHYKIRTPRDAEVFQAVACYSFEELGSTAKQAAAPELLKLFDSPDENLRGLARSLLFRFGPAAKLATPKLIEYLTNSDWELRSNACKVLAEIGPDAKAAVPALIQHCEDAMPGTPAWYDASWALRSIDRETWRKVCLPRM